MFKIDIIATLFLLLSIDIQKEMLDFSGLLNLGETKSGIGSEHVQIPNPDPTKYRNRNPGLYAASSTSGGFPLGKNPYS